MATEVVLDVNLGMVTLESSTQVGPYIYENTYLFAPDDVDDATFTLQLNQTDGPVLDQGFAVMTVSSPPAPTLDAFDALTDEGTVTLSGNSVGDQVEISLGGVVTIIPVVNGRFTTTLPLVPNKNNMVHITPLVGAFRGQPRVEGIARDNAAPIFSVLFPDDGDIINTAVTDVAGTIGDVLSGIEGMTVTVNGVAAEVDVGVGTNGSFFAMGVPLTADDDTVLEVIATDSQGNARTHMVTVTHVTIVPGTPKIEYVRGNAQTAEALNGLADPIVIRAVDGMGDPMPGQSVTFQVTRSDGLLFAPARGVMGERRITMTTDMNGEAQVLCRLR